MILSRGQVNVVRRTIAEIQGIVDCLTTSSLEETRKAMDANRVVTDEEINAIETSLEGLRLLRRVLRVTMRRIDRHFADNA